MKIHHHSDHPELFQKSSKAIHQSHEAKKYFGFNYRISIPPKRNYLLLWVYHGKKLMTRFEQFGIHALHLHQHHHLPSSELDPDHRKFAIHLLRFAHLNASEGYFAIPKKHVAFFLPKLSRFNLIQFFDSGKPVKFSEHFLSPTVQLQEQGPAEIRLQLHFCDVETQENFSYSAVTVFPGRRPWAFCGETCYPIKNSLLTPLLEDFDEEGILLLKGEKAADFIQDYLPQLSKKPEVILPEGFHLPEVSQPKPEVIYEISEDLHEDKLVLIIQFSYDKNVVPPFETEADALIQVQQEGQPRLIRRDLHFEHQILKQYLAQGFHRVGPNRFETGGVSALDFVSETLPQLEPATEVKGGEQLHRFQLMGELGAKQLKARVKGGGIDWLEIEMGFEIEGAFLSYEAVQAVLAKGEKYLRLPGKGFAKIQLDDLHDLEEKLSEIEATFTQEGRLKVSRYHAAYLDEILSPDWSVEKNLGAMIHTLKENRQILQRALPTSLEPILREYQHHGFDWLNFLHDYRFHGILADDMGLGKTLQALAYLQDQKDRLGSAPALVLAPTSVVFNWASEAEKFTPNLKVLMFTGAKRKRLHQEMASSDLVLTSYALFRRDAEFLTQHPWRVVILDEAQNIKNYRSKTALLVKKLVAEQRWALTGTPLENRLSELWSIFDFLMPGFLGGYAHFKRKYQQPIEIEQSSEHLERLRKRIFPFVMRRLKSEVAKELPAKTEVTHYCEMAHEQHKLYHHLLMTCRQQVFAEVEKKGIGRSHVSILTALLRLRQVCCHPALLGSAFKNKEIVSGKMEAFQDLVTEVLSEGHRILVFSQFVEMLSLLRTWLEEQKIAYEYLDGRTRNRQERIQRFNKSSDIPLFLVSLRAGGTGLNLTGADYVIHFDPWWNPAVQDQATDRVHRIGQKKHVFSYKLITKDTVEEKILMLQERKRNLAKGLLSVDSALGKQLSFEDLEYLFS